MTTTRKVFVLANMLIVAFIVVAGLIAAVGTRAASSVARQASAEHLAPATVTIRILNKTFANLSVALTDGHRSQVLGDVHQDSAAEFSAREWLDNPAKEVQLMGQGVDGTWMSRSVRVVGGDLVVWDVEPYHRISHVRVMKRD